MRKLRFKNRNGVLYFGFGDKLKSSRLKYTTINKNIIIGKFKSGKLSNELGLDIESGVPLVLDILDDVITEKSRVLKHKTMLAYNSVKTTHIIPFFEDLSVAQIKPLDIKKFQDKMFSKGLQRQSITVARILLSEVFDIAVLGEHIKSNPVKSVRMPKYKSVKKKKQLPLNLDEIDMILSDTQGQMKNFFGISFFTGMRSGELLALKWEDIDFDTDTISITKTVADGFINEPKTLSSHRDIELLEYAREYFLNQRLETGLSNSYVFLNKQGSYHGSNTLFYQNFQKVLERNNLKTRALHNTRHTFASLMLNNGIDALWVSHTLGHGNVNVTLTIYAHFMPKKEKISIGFLEKRYKNGTSAE